MENEVRMSMKVRLVDAVKALAEETLTEDEFKIEGNEIIFISDEVAQKFGSAFSNN